MNIFVLDEDPLASAKYHCDKHVIKMVLESCQMMGSCVWKSVGVNSKKKITEESLKIWKDFPRETPYGVGFMNHPCTKWARESKTNWLWLCSLAEGLAAEYETRYQKPSSMKPIIEWFKNKSYLFDEKGLTPFAQAMPDHIKSESAVHSYRLYYALHKKDFAKWKTQEPFWWKEYLKMTSYELSR